MELDEYIRILIRRWPVWLSAIVLVGALGFVYASRIPTSYDGYASMSFVKKMVSPAEQTADYQYDNFYSLESSRLLTQVASGWIADPLVVAEVYRAAGVSIPEGVTVAHYGQLVTAQALPGATMQITTHADSSGAAEELASETQKLVTNRIDALIADGTLTDVQILTTIPLSNTRTTSTTLYAAAGMLVGALLGFVLTFIVESLRKNR